MLLQKDHLEMMHMPNLMTRRYFNLFPNCMYLNQVDPVRGQLHPSVREEAF